MILGNIRSSAAILSSCQRLACLACWAWFSGTLLASPFRTNDRSIISQALKCQMCLKGRLNVNVIECENVIDQSNRFCENFRCKHGKPLIGNIDTYRACNGYVVVEDQILSVLLCSLCNKPIISYKHKTGVKCRII